MDGNEEKIYEIHIGKTLRKLLKSRGLSTAQLAGKINVAQSSVSRMLHRKYLHSKTMLDISRALDHDLFQYLYQPGEWPANKALQQQTQKLEKENDQLKQENTMLKKINSLLEQNERL